MLILRSQASDLNVILLGLRRERRKRFSWNKTKISSSFLLILTHVFRYAKYS